MLINAFERADSSLRSELLRWMTATDYEPQSKIAAVTEIYNKLGIDKLAKEKINYYFAESRKYLDAVSVPASRKSVLEAYTDAMMHREV